MDFLTQPLVWLLHELYNVTGNLGVSIIVLTLMIRAALIPFTLPAMKSQKQMRALQPQLAALKEKFGSDKLALAQAQQALYKENNVNPLGGCLPYLLQFAVLIGLYQVLNRFIGEGASGLIENVTFLGFDLTQRDTTFILPLLAAGTQFILSLMIMPGGETRDIIPNKSKSSKTRKVNEKEEDLADMAGMMQKQMMYVMPVMTGVFAASFPAGLGLYWVTTTVFSVIQQFFITGLGGLRKFIPGLKEENFTVETLEVMKNEAQPAKSQPAKGKKSAPKKSKPADDAFAAAFLQTATKQIKSGEVKRGKPSTKPTKKKTTKKGGKTKRKAQKK